MINSTRTRLRSDLAAARREIGRLHKEHAADQAEIGRLTTLADNLTDALQEAEAHAANLRKQLATAHLSVAHAEAEQKRRLIDSLTARLDAAQAQSEAMAVPGDLFGVVTPEEWQALVVAAADPIRERLGQNPELRRLRAEGRFGEAEKYMERLARLADAKAATA